MRYLGKLKLKFVNGTQQAIRNVVRIWLQVNAIDRRNKKGKIKAIWLQ